MKCVLVFIAALVLFSSLAAGQNHEGDRVQQFGNLSHRSFLIYSGPVSWLNGGPANRVVRQTIRFPHFEHDEGRTPQIGAIIVTHDRNERNSNCILSWGGPGRRYAGVDCQSAPGRSIDSFVEIFSI